MDLKVALKFVNAEVFKYEKRNLTPLEITIFCGSWAGNTYNQIAKSSEYSFNYLMRDVGPKFWRLLTKIFGENVNKNNIQAIISKRYQIKSSLVQDASVTKPQSQKERVERSGLSRDWENAPVQFDSFYGYQEELETLKQWIVGESSHLINLWGIKGVGKTALMREIAIGVEAEFDFVIWRSLGSAPTFDNLVNSLRDILRIEPNADKKDLGMHLLTKMRSHSCLILLDGVEAILQPGQQAGTYLPGYEDYNDFFQLVGESSHKSCVITTSIESLSGIFQFTGENSPIHSVKLSGLSLSAGKSLLATKKLTEPQAMTDLIRYYQGNPAMLGIAAKIIKELFNQHIAEFLAQKSLIFGDIARLLEKSFDRLSMLEEELLFWLASEDAVSIAEIQSRIPINIYPVELLETIESLNQRSLIQSSESQAGSSFSLSPMIREFTVNRFITQIGTNSVKERHQGHRGSVVRGLKISPIPSKQTHLSNWLANNFELGWQPIETLFSLTNKSPVRLRSAFYFRDRDTVKRFKEIEVGSSLSERVILLVAITPEESSLGICVQAQPEIERRVLPQQLQICLVDRADNIIAEARSGAQDNFIQLPYFYGERGEKFKIKLNLNSATYEEEFLI